MTVNLWGLVIGHDEGGTTRGDGGRKGGIGVFCWGLKGILAVDVATEKQGSPQVRPESAHVLDTPVRRWGKSSVAPSSVGMYSSNNKSDETTHQDGRWEPPLECCNHPPHPVNRSAPDLAWLPPHMSIESPPLAKLKFCC